MVPLSHFSLSLRSSLSPSLFCDYPLRVVVCLRETEAEGESDRKVWRKRATDQRLLLCIHTRSVSRSLHQLRTSATFARFNLPRDCECQPRNFHIHLLPLSSLMIVSFGLISPSLVPSLPLSLSDSLPLIITHLMSVF